jgi:hypothetical protein
LRTTFSHTAASAGTFARSNASSISPPVFKRSLWQETQYWFRLARVEADEGSAIEVGEDAAEGCCPLMTAEASHAATTARTERRARINTLPYLVAAAGLDSSPAQ